MGEVYKANDTRLERAVAIKVSKEQFSERFEREAHAVAALNHPNICQLYDIGPNYLVMELVEGRRWPIESGRALWRFRWRWSSPSKSRMPRRLLKLTGCR